MTLIQFNTAKLAREKGFKFQNAASENDYQGENPTQSELQKWLREKHNIYVIITEEFYTDGINHNIQILTYDLSNVENNYINNDKSTKIYGDNGEFKTYEKALEFGLQKALKLI
jgi:hypothetical protein